uniref:Pribosyltran domain-containing protein n=1 Tax=Syphacia muris TaxID=451379 RepID=A0A0N5AMN9_9BILA
MICLQLSLDSLLLPSCYKNDLSSVIIPCGMIKDRVKRLAIEIHEVIKDEPLTLLCILKGSYRFFTTLVDELIEVRSRSCRSLLSIEFVRVQVIFNMLFATSTILVFMYNSDCFYLQSYSGTKSTGQVKLLGLSSMEELEGRNVLVCDFNVVEDIVDSGCTLSKILNTLKLGGVKKAWTAILLSKRMKRINEVPEDFVAFDIPDKFVVGYGLDYNQRFRDLQHICIVSEAGIAKYKNAEKKE